MASDEWDLGGITIVAKGLKIGATTPGQGPSATSLSGTELGFLDAVTAGTAAASKAVVLDSSSAVSGFTFSTMPLIPTATVAAAGTTAANAGALVTGFNLVTGADDTKGVVLPAAAAGKVVIIKVGDGADLKIWPATGDAINAIAVDSAMTVVDDVALILVALNATTWYTVPLLPS